MIAQTKKKKKPLRPSAEAQRGHGCQGRANLAPRCAPCERVDDILDQREGEDLHTAGCKVAALEVGMNPTQQVAIDRAVPASNSEGPDHGHNALPLRLTPQRGGTADGQNAAAS